MSEYNETIQNNEYIEEDAGVLALEELENVDEFYGDSSEVTHDDIISQSTGLDEFDNPKAGFALELGTYDARNNTAKINSCMTYYNPSLNIVRTGEAIMFDFIYKSKTDSELRAFWALINKYGREFEQAMKENNHIIPLMRLQIVPNYYAGKFSMLCVTPMYWCLQPEVPAGEIKVIRIVFSVDSVAFIESEGYNENEILAELEREEMQKQHIEQSIERRREEESLYQEERNARLEELRRNRQD